MNTIFVDTIGFGSSLNYSNLVKCFKTELQMDDRSDSILLVVTQEQLRNVASLKNTIDYINKVVKRVENSRHNTQVPIICVLNKIDQYFPDGLSDSEECTNEIKEHMQEAIEIVNEFLKTKATQCIVTSTNKSYDIEELRTSINAQSPLNAQIIQNDFDYMKKHRWVLGNKIKGSFSTASATTSFLPIADIVIVTILQEWMYQMLACFSTDPNRTPDTFKERYGTAQSKTFFLRAAASAVGAVFCS